MQHLLQKYSLIGVLLLCLSTANAGTTASATTTQQHTTPATQKTTAPASPMVSSITVNIPCVADSPCAIITGTSKQVLQAVDEGLTPTKTMNLIQTVVAPQFDFTLMTKYALGKNWKLATVEQQTQLLTLFKELLIYTYASALAKFKGAQITITSSGITGRKATVITQVLLPNTTNNNTQPVKVEYDLAKSQHAGAWKVYDIKIENASLVTTYRNQFNDVIQTNQVAGLIKQLQTKLTNLKISPQVR